MKATTLEIGAAYIRVSTDDQTELSPDAQLRTIMDSAKQDGFVIPQEFIFEEERGISGRKAENDRDCKVPVSRSLLSPVRLEIFQICTQPRRKYVLQGNSPKEMWCRGKKRIGTNRGGYVWAPDRDHYRMV